MNPRRYQLNKSALTVLASGHPWIFRGQLSSAAAVFADGQWLALFDGNNRIVGYGIFEAEGAIAIRVLSRDGERPRGKMFANRVDIAMAKRATLRPETDAIRWIHGESDGLPGVVVEQVGAIIVYQSYGRGSDALARFAARAVATRLGKSLGSRPTIIAKGAQRRRLEVDAIHRGARVILGDVPSSTAIGFREGPLSFFVDVLGGQKSGTYLDLRGLRRWMREQKLASKAVLNLFAYTGMLGRCAELAGAASIVQVDASAPALAFSTAHHVADPMRYQNLVGDIFDWLPQHASGPSQYDVVIVDPPNMTSRNDQVPNALATYRRLYSHAMRLVRPGGVLIAACCTSRIERGAFRKTVAITLGSAFRLESELPTEVDHPVGFREADYLKIFIWRRVLP